MGYLLGIDLGSSSVKASLLDAATGVCVGSAFYPETEAPIAAPEAGFAEQNPADWYDDARSAIRDTMSGHPFLADRRPAQCEVQNGHHPAAGAGRCSLCKAGC